jgi:hypothetical protein
MRRAAAVVLLVGCAQPVEIVRPVTPSEAEQANGTKLHAVAVLRGGARAAIPADARVEAGEVRVPRPGIFTYSLDPGETVVRDPEQRIIGVKSGASLTKFIVGTATLEGSDVRGELEGHVERVPLLPGDRVELRGRFAPGETVPTGGKVVVTRSWSALGFGGALVVGAWLPSLIVGAASGIDANHWLYLPAIGPWIAYATRDACTPATDPRPCLNDAAERVGLIADGIIQSTGAVLMAVGIPSSAEVRWGKEGRARIGPSLGGLRIEGTF